MKKNRPANTCCCFFMHVLCTMYHGWLVNWGKRHFETIFQSISGRLSEKGCKKREMIDERKNVQTIPPVPAASTVGPRPTIIQIVGRPGTGGLPRTIVISTSFRRHVPTRSLINQCQIIIFLILKSDIIENSRIELRGIVLSVPSNQIKVTFIIISPFNLVHL